MIKKKVVLLTLHYIKAQTPEYSLFVKFKGKGGYMGTFLRPAVVGVLWTRYNL